MSSTDTGGMVTHAARAGSLKSTVINVKSILLRL